MVMNKKILFLTLKVFSATGGIEKVCKIASLALNQLVASAAGTLQVFSMYDDSIEADSKYLPANMFRGYQQKKINFILGAVKEGLSSDIVMVSHINLISVGYIIKLLRPKTKLVLYAHGIEVWGPLTFWRQKMLQKCNMIMCVSNYTKEKMLQQYNIGKENVCVLNNCIDPYLPPVETGKDGALQMQYGFTSEDLVLMTLTRLSSKELYKGYDHVLVALQQLRKRFQNLKYLIVGRYDDVEKKRIDNIIKEYGLENYVVFTGYVPDEQLAKHYGLGDIYVMPSKKEGFGIVFIEAMYYGLPVIAGNKDGSADALCNGKLGVLVDPDNQAEITSAIEKMILNRTQYKPDNILLESSFSFTSYKNKLLGFINRL
jgi:phosphatidyl-myo-inositol dimannoside synthase